MASASSGRYQSRLFNFAHQQSRRLTQQCDRAFRHLQVATSAVVPVVLYPIYLLFQSTRSAAKQVHHSMQQSLPQLPADNTDSLPETPPFVDTPIQRVLLAVDSLQSEEAVLTPSKEKNEPLNFWGFLSKLGFNFLPHSPKSTSNLTHSCSPFLDSSRPTIQGIATQVSSRALVLVTAQNEILDIFTPQQQQKLQERIIGEVAGYWRYQRLAHSPEQLNMSTPAKLFSPVSLFSSMIAWVQTGAVAIALGGGSSPIADNIFQEPSLVRRQKTRGELPEAEGRISTHQALVFLDRTVAALESKHLAPASEVVLSVRQHSWELVKLVQTQLTVYLFGKLQPNGSKSSASATLNGVITLNGSETYKSRIQILIFAAINYFFGGHGEKPIIVTAPTTDSLELPSGAKPRAKPLPHRRSTFRLPSADQLISADEDPWLTLGDLFGEPELEGEASTLYKPESLISQTTSRLTGKTNLTLLSSQLNRYSLRNLLNRFQAFLPQSKQISGRSSQQKTTKGKGLGKVGSKQLSPLPKSPQSLSKGESNQPSSQNTQLEPQPDWIETNATAIGYVKHPLEQLLQWLDRAMLWLEELLMKVLQQVQRLWRGK